MGTWSDDVPVSEAPFTYAGLPDVIDDFSCGDWAVYLKRNREFYGISKAREIMLIDFGHVGAFNFEFPICEFHCSFVREVNTIDPEYLSLLSSVYCGVTDATESVIAVAQNAADAAESTSKNLKWMLPVGLGIGGLYLLNQIGVFEPIKRRLRK